MKAVISPCALNGTVSLPSSKSASHRAIICAALADGQSRIRGVSMSQDIEATVGAMRSMGADIRLDGDDIVIQGIKNAPSSADVDCGESGSTLRFLLPVAAALGIDAEFTGRGKLPSRPVSDITGLMQKNGVQCIFESDENLPLRIKGRLCGGRFVIAGNVSSQYISGLMFALTLTGGEIVLTTPLQSAGYVDMTISALRDFGGKITPTPTGWTVEKRRLLPREYRVEGDWSQAAFFLSAAALGGRLTLRGLRRQSVQGDMACLELFRRIGAEIEWKGDDLVAQPGELRPINVDASQIPDLVPALAVTLAYVPGRSLIHSAERLRIKECDRLSAVANGLSACGIDVGESPDSLTINGGAFGGGTVDGCNDHRIVMAFSIAAAAAKAPLTVTDAQAINKSYPDFFNTFRSIGGAVNVL